MGILECASVASVSRDYDYFKEKKVICFAEMTEVEVTSFFFLSRVISSAVEAVCDFPPEETFTVSLQAYADAEKSLE